MNTFRELWSRSKPLIKVSLGINGIARYSDEAYKVSVQRRRQEQPHRDRSPHVPDEVPPVRGGIN